MALEGVARCIVFADVSGSSRLYERLGDAEALRAVERCLNRVERAAAVYGGRRVKSIGDEVMLVFPSAEEGVLAACEMQQRVEDLPPVSGVAMAIRVGLQYGPVLEEGGDVFGDTVNTAARLVELAKAWQILAGADALAAMPATTRPRVRGSETVAVKGRREPLAMTEVLWRAGDEDLTLMPDRFPPTQPNGLRLRVRHGDRAFVLDTQRPTLSLGREVGNDLVIRDGRASRHHGRIECRGDNFVLVDQSSNGTYVMTEGLGEFRVRREEAILRGRGRLSFGHSATEAEDVLEYWILD